MAALLDVDPYLICASRVHSASMWRQTQSVSRSSIPPSDEDLRSPVRLRWVRTPDNLMVSTRLADRQHCHVRLFYAQDLPYFGYQWGVFRDSYFVGWAERALVLNARPRGEIVNSTSIPCGIMRDVHRCPHMSTIAKRIWACMQRKNGSVLAIDMNYAPSPLSAPRLERPVAMNLLGAAHGGGFEAWHQTQRSPMAAWARLL